MNSLQKLFKISRPISWINTAYPFAAAYLVTGGGVTITLVVATLFFLVPYNLLMYGINDVFDYESDIRNPRKGGIEGAVEQKAFHPVIIWSSLICSAPFVAYLGITGTVQTNVVLAVLLFAVVAYSAAGLRFKERPVLDSITSSTHFVGPMVYALCITGFEMSYLPFVVAFFCWGAASHAFGAVQDIVPDRKAGISSVATVIGARRTMYIVTSLYLVASTILITRGGLSVLVGLAGLVYVANCVPFLNIDDATSGKANKGWRRFIWLNLFTGFIVTIALLLSKLT